MKATVQEWGNGLGFRIPAHWAKEYDIKNGSKVEIIIENIHSELSTGCAVGKEEW